MNSEVFCKKLAFTIESVEKNSGHVTGIVELDNGTCVYFDDNGIIVKDKDGGALWEVDYYDFCDKDNKNHKKCIRDLVLEGIIINRVVRVYPDCC